MKTEIALCMLWLAGIILWFCGFVYSVEVVGVALVLLAFVYFPFGFYFFPVDKQHNLVFSVVCGYLLFMAPLALLSGLLRFPIVKLQAGVGCCVLPVLLLVTVMLFRNAPPEMRGYYKAQLVRTGTWLLVTVIVRLTFPLPMPTF